jgi:hypothetical protein
VSNPKSIENIIIILFHLGPKSRARPSPSPSQKPRLLALANLSALPFLFTVVAATEVGKEVERKTADL